MRHTRDARGNDNLIRHHAIRHPVSTFSVQRSVTHGLAGPVQLCIGSAAGHPAPALAQLGKTLRGAGLPVVMSRRLCLSTEELSLPKQTPPPLLNPPD